MLIVLAFALITTVVFSACNTNNSNSKLNIVCTIFPQYDWVKQIVGECDNVQVELLMQNGTDMHSYELTFSDMAKISNADVFIYVGGESDESWVNKAISNATNKNMVCVNLVEILGEKALVEEEKEGMQEGRSHHEEGEEEYHHEEEVDEHVWLSIKNASFYINYLANKLGEIDVGNKQTFIDNANAYLSSLNALDSKCAQMVQEANVNTIVVADRFPFRYLVHDYNLDYFEAFSGCSTDADASFETVTFLANKLDELHLNYVIKIDGSDSSVPQAVIDATENKNQKILTINSMQTISSNDINSGCTYLSIMQQNYQILKEALTNE